MKRTKYNSYTNASCKFENYLASVIKLNISVLLPLPDLQLWWWCFHSMIECWNTAALSCYCKFGNKFSFFFTIYVEWDCVNNWSKVNSNQILWVLQAGKVSKTAKSEDKWCGWRFKLSRVWHDVIGQIQQYDSDNVTSQRTWIFKLVIDWGCSVYHFH